MKVDLTEDQKISLSERLLNDSVFCDYIQNKKWEYFTQWTIAQTTEEREEIHAKLTGLLDLQADLTTLAKRNEIIQETDNG